MRISVYNQTTHIHALTLDLQRAKLIVIIQSPYLAEKNIERWAPELKKQIARGVIICVFVNLPEHYYGKHPKEHKETENRNLRKCVKLLEDMGVHVNVVPNIHTKLIVIDYRWLWDGSLNFLSSNPESDISERANRYDDVIHTMAAYAHHNLERCFVCETKGRKNSEGLFFLGEKAISRPSNQGSESTRSSTSPNSPTPEWRSKGKLSYSLDSGDLIEKSKGEKFPRGKLHSWLQHKRIELGFKASEMADGIKVNKSSLSYFEAGRSTPSLATLVKFVRKLGWQVILVPRDLVPLMDYIVRSYHNSEVAKLTPKPSPIRKRVGRPPQGLNKLAESNTQVGNEPMLEDCSPTENEPKSGAEKATLKPEEQEEQHFSKSTSEAVINGTADEVNLPPSRPSGLPSNSL